MSKNNNVNPGQYKVAGRERPGEDIVQDSHKQRMGQSRAGTKTGVPAAGKEKPARTRRGLPAGAGAGKRSAS